METTLWLISAGLALLSIYLLCSRANARAVNKGLTEQLIQVRLENIALKALNEVLNGQLLKVHEILNRVNKRLDQLSNINKGASND